MQLILTLTKVFNGSKRATALNSKKYKYFAPTKSKWNVYWSWLVFLWNIRKAIRDNDQSSDCGWWMERECGCHMRRADTVHRTWQLTSVTDSSSSWHSMAVAIGAFKFALPIRPDLVRILPMYTASTKKEHHWSPKRKYWQTDNWF